MKVDPFGLPPDEAIRWFQQKGYALTFDWRDQWAAAHARAFTVAKATQLDVLADLREAVDRAIREGRSLGQFRKELRPTLQSKGWWGEKEVDALGPDGRPILGPDGKPERRVVQLGSSRRLQTIYATNLRQAQAAGRWERFERTKAARPYGRYVCTMDGRERAEHRAWHDTILPLDHPWWATHAPPNGWGCRCKMQQLSERDLERYGLKVSEAAPSSPMQPYVNERTGETVMVPKGIDPGFNYNPGQVPRGWSPPDNAPVLHPVRSFADEGRPSVKDVAPSERRPQPERWPEPGTRAARDAVLDQFATLFGVARGRDAETADPQGVQVTFPQSMLDYLTKKEPKRVQFVPSAKATIEDPFEVWMVPFRLRDGRVVMRKRYIGLFDGPSGAEQLVVVNRTDEGHAAYNTYPSRSLDSQRQGYLLYARGAKRSP